MSRQQCLILLALTLSSTMSNAVPAQTSDAAEESSDAAERPRLTALPSPDNADEARARLYGVLMFTNISIDIETMPAREAIRRLGDALGVPIRGRFNDDPLGYGIDPDTPITIQQENVGAQAVIEDLLGQCEADAGPCTWQFRTGYIELGTKERLSVPSARDARRYYIGDVIKDQAPTRPERREFLAVRLVGRIVENIEPGTWDYGQLPDEEESEVNSPEVGKPYDQPGSGRGGGKAPGRAGTDEASRAAAPEPRYVMPRKIATIRYWRDIILITAPDYYHRQIDGYGKPIPPPGWRPDAPNPLVRVES